jgi:hypothetical protein
MGRYKLMGYEIEGHDTNPQSVPIGEQRKDALEARTVVYETDELAEAKTITQAGGFFRNRDQFVTVTMMVDSESTVSGPITGGTRSTAQPFPQKG